MQPYLLFNPELTLDYQKLILNYIDGNIKEATVKMHRKEFQAFLNDILEAHIASVQKEEVDDIIGKFIIGLLLEIKDMVAISARMVKIHPVTEPAVRTVK